MTTAMTVTQSKVTKPQRLRLWVQRLALAFLILGPLVFFVAAFGYKFGIWDLGFSFGTLTRKLGPLLLMTSFGLGVVGLLLGMTIKPRRGLVISLLAMLVPAVGIMHAKNVTKTATNLPLIHDITTDTQDPPSFSDAILSERSKTERVNTVDYIGKLDREGGQLVSVLQVEGYPDIRPLVLADTPEVAFGRAKAAVKSMGWDVVTEDPAAGIIEATDTTFWYGFKDDVVIRIRPSEGGGSVLDIRSISRVGRSDIGANAARIRKFTKVIRG